MTYQEFGQASAAHRKMLMQSTSDLSYGSGDDGFKVLPSGHILDSKKFTGLDSGRMVWDDPR